VNATRFVPARPPLVAGAAVRPLAPVSDARGRLVEILSASDPLFRGFAHAYVTTAYPGVVKAWHLHREQTDTLVVVAGMARVVLYDGREGSPTRDVVNEFACGVHAPLLVQIPPGVLHGFQCLGPSECTVLNLPDRPYRPDAPDEWRLPPDDPSVPFDWRSRDG